VEREDLMQATYQAFNTPDIDAVLRPITADVDSPNAWEGSCVHGHDRVRPPIGPIDPAVTPTPPPRDRMAVSTKSNRSHAPSTGLSSANDVSCMCEAFRDDHVARIDVEELASTA